MFSKTCEYAIRAMIYIASQSKQDKRVGINEIALAINSPSPFIGKILQDLVRQGLVQSAKGPHGGFYINSKSMKQSLADIVKAVDGDKLFSGCGIGLDYCSEKRPCPIHFEFKKLRKDIFEMLNNARLEAFDKQLEAKLAFLKRS